MIKHVILQEVFSDVSSIKFDDLFFRNSATMVVTHFSCRCRHQSGSPNLWPGCGGWPTGCKIAYEYKFLFIYSSPAHWKLTFVGVSVCVCAKKGTIYGMPPQLVPVWRIKKWTFCCWGAFQKLLTKVERLGKELLRIVTFFWKFVIANAKC